MDDKPGTMSTPAHYPSPPFPEQKQDYPGLAQKMEPVPDHGEHSYRGNARLQGKKALITGADSGIGRAVAIAFAREGADIAMNYLPVEEDDAKQVADYVKQAGQKVVAIPGDLKDETFCTKLVQDAVDGLGSLDIVVNNAGRQVYCKSLTDISTAQFDDTFKVNIYAPFWITRAALPHLKSGASIINTASSNAREPSEGLVDYAATKGAIVAFTQALAKQLGGKGIRVNAVAPGPFWTVLQPSGGQSTEKVMHFGEDTPLGRPGQPAEIASVYVLLASDEASFMSGSLVPVTGGKIL